MSRSAVRSLLVAIAICLPSQAFAQEAYPTRPIRMIVPWAAGNFTDIVARKIADKLSGVLQQPVWIDNMPGANAARGHIALALAAPDGYTIANTSTGPMCITPVLTPTLGFDPKNFSPIAGILVGPPLVLSVNTSTHFSDLKQFLKAAQSNPKGISYATAGYGTTQHITGELFKAVAGAHLVHVPYRGAAASTVGVLGSDVQAQIEVVSVALPYIKAGKLIPLAVSSPHRDPLLPNVPTFSELGYPSVVTGGFQGLIGPPGLPERIRERLSAAVRKIVDTDEMRGWASAQGVSIHWMSPHEFETYLNSQQAQWEKKIHEAGLGPIH